eukprot:TRINITY_DN2040_c0_g2_i3.p1 TRINITY_DN2040_c0_g2~~TRINITY_DN2040_c0_g2_i3.p1  ORF type:complete len:198 (+),score=19.83 TRINITY_DN2040_c0_g2_i3:184-777(+)
MLTNSVQIQKYPQSNQHSHRMNKHYKNPPNAQQPTTKNPPKWNRGKPITNSKRGQQLHHPKNQQWATGNVQHGHPLGGAAIVQMLTSKAKYPKAILIQGTCRKTSPPTQHQHTTHHIYNYVGPLHFHLCGTSPQHTGEEVGYSTATGCPYEYVAAVQQNAATKQESYQKKNSKINKIKNKTQNWNVNNKRMVFKTLF